MFCSFSCYCCCWAVPLFQVLGVGEVAEFPRRDKSWWEAEHITPTLVALALLHQLSLLLLLLRLLLLLPFPAFLLLVLLSLSLRPFLWTLPNTMSAPFVLCYLIAVPSQDLRHEQLKYNFVLLYNAILKLPASSKVELIQGTSTNAMWCWCNVIRIY